jgi:hypothetical protein
LLLHPIEHKAVDLAFRWHATARYSDGDIAERLNEYVLTLPDGAEVRLRTKGRWGRGSPGRFSKDTVRDLLQNPYYIGKVPYYGRNKDGQRRKRGNYVALYPGQHESIVDEETFDRSQRIRSLMSHNPRSRDDVLERIYVLSGILRCGYCGEPMRAQSSGGTRYYRDKSRALHIRDCPQCYVHADDVETEIGRIVERIQLAPGWREAIAGELHPDLDADEIEERKDAIEAKLERAKQLYIDGDIGRVRYEQEKAHCRVQLSDLQPVGYDDIISVGTFLESVSEWDALAPLKQKERLRMLFATVLIRGTRLVAAKPTEALYALIQHSAGARRQPLFEGGCHRNSGADGSRSRRLHQATPPILPAVPLSRQKKDAAVEHICFQNRSNRSNRSKPGILTVISSPWKRSRGVSPLASTGRL